MASEKIKVVITVKFDEDILKQLREISPQLDISARPAKAYTDIPAHVWEDVEVLYTLGVFPPEDATPKLRWVQSHSAGVDILLRQPFISENPEVVVTSTRGIHATNMGEYALAMMLALARHLPNMLKLQGKKEWPDDRAARFQPIELRGSTVGIVGYGAIGREVARLAKTLGMSVLASKRDLMDTDAAEHYRVEGTGDPESILFDRMYPPQALATMVRDCDFVVVITPLTENTRNLYDARVIQSMKRGSFLINIGRGGVVDEVALLEALQSGHLGGAAMDVFAEEPLPPDNPLWSAPNMIISPHIAGGTANYSQKAAAVFIENLERYLEGKPLMNVVDRQAGY